MGALKIAIPLLIIAGLLSFILPMLFIWFVNDTENNVTVTGSNAGIWTTFQHGMNMMATLFGNTSWVLGMILIIIVILLFLGGLFLVAKKIAA